MVTQWLCFRSIPGSHINCRPAESIIVTAVPLHIRATRVKPSFLMSQTGVTIDVFAPRICGAMLSMMSRILVALKFQIIVRWREVSLKTLFTRVGLAEYVVWSICHILLSVNGFNRLDWVTLIMVMYTFIYFLHSDFDMRMMTDTLSATEGFP